MSRCIISVEQGFEWAAGYSLKLVETLLQLAQGQDSHHTAAVAAELPAPGLGKVCGAFIMGAN